MSKIEALEKGLSGFGLLALKKRRGASRARRKALFA
jgi:hypothetical protein